jgi:hypothetical protein
MPKITKFKRLHKEFIYKDYDIEEKLITLIQKKDGTYQLNIKLIVEYYICDCCDCSFNCTDIKYQNYNGKDPYIEYSKEIFNINLGNIPEYLGLYICKNIYKKGYCTQSFGEIEFAKIEADYSKYNEYVENCKKVFIDYDKKLPDEILYTIVDFF